MNSLLILVLGLLIISILLILFIPEKGLLFKIKKMRKDWDRILTEDALKHLYDCEFNKIDCSLNSIAGNLNINGEKASSIIKSLTSRGLIVTNGNKITLTTDGRNYALRIVRIHRLWERYLAENTSVSENEWHAIAEEREHDTSEDYANELAAKLGNPLLDPHGDPIPNRKGEILVAEGISLNNLQVNEYAKIIHIEDEPKEVYAQLIAEGLYPGMQVFLLEKSMEKITFEADGNECVLAPILASYISVQPIKEIEKIHERYDTLSSLEIDESAIVVSISNALRGQQRRRLLDFGIVPGTLIQGRLKSLKGDPAAFEVRGTLIALRRNQSDLINIKKVKN